MLQFPNRNLILRNRWLAGDITNVAASVIFEVEDYGLKASIDDANNTSGQKQARPSFGQIGSLASKYPPAKPGALRLLAPQRGLIAIAKK